MERLTPSFFYYLIVCANLLWFSAGFFQFWVMAKVSARRIVLKSDSRYQTVIAGLLRFLGGLNLSLAVLSAMMLQHPPGSPHSRDIATTLLTFTVAHGSQFLVNLPVARDEIAGNPVPWSVFNGTMMMIFVVDLLLMILNGALAVASFLT